MIGIIFIGGEKPAKQIIKRVIEEAGNSLLIAADSGLVAAQGAGLQPDWVIGDMDSIDDLKRLSALPPERVMRYPHDKDALDTELAITLALEKGCDEIWLIGGGGGRIDHLFALRALFEREFFPRRWVTDAADIRCIDAKTQQGELSLQLEKGAAVSVFPLGEGPWNAQSSGLKWPLAGLPWDRGFFGVSNVALEGDFYIKAEEGKFMVIMGRGSGE